MINILKVSSKTTLIIRVGIGMIFALPSFFLAQIANAESTLCGYSAPKGYVITGNTYSSNCGSYDTYIPENAITIGIPYSGDIICDNSFLPKDYVITDNLYSSNCGRYDTYKPENAFRIGIPYSGDIICDSSPIPKGYVTTGSVYSSNCGRYDTYAPNNARTIRKL